MSKRFVVFAVTSIAAATFFAFGCGGGSSSTDDTTTNPPSSDEPTTGTITGQVAVSAADANLAAPISRTLSKSVPLFKTAGDTALAGADVNLYKMFADGTEQQVEGITATTDSSGSYTLSNVPSATTGTGAATDFYYEVRATSGALDVRAPTAPTAATTTVNVSPETHLAAKMLTDVQNITDDVLPHEETIEAIRELTLEEVGEDMAGKIELPSLTSEDNVVIAATAIASNGGNSEKGLRTFEAEKEELAIEDSTDVSQVGSYLERVGRQGCNHNQNFNLPDTVRDALAQVFISAETVTPQEIVTAFNSNNGANPDAEVATGVLAFDTILDNIDNAITEGGQLTSTDQVAMFVKRDLSASVFDSATELKADQMMAFVNGLLPEPCQTGTFDIIGFASDISGSDIVDAPSIIDKQIYNDAMASCSGGAAHLAAEVQVYAAGGATVSGVTISRGGVTKDMTINGQNGPFSRWRRYAQQGDGNFSTDLDCVTLPSDAEYTIAVDLDGGFSDLTGTATVNHRSVPEASISFVDTDGNETPLSNSSVTPIDSQRPIFKWSPQPGPPAESVVANAPADSEIKFTFELSHVITQAVLNSWFGEDDEGRGNVNEGPLASCGIGGSDQKLMDRNYFIADSDCDPAACLAVLQSSPTMTFITNGGQQVTKNTSEIQESDIACRTNIATFLVDENDRYLGVGAGNFRFYCFDSNADGDCAD